MKIKRNPLRTWTPEEINRAIHVELLEQRNGIQIAHEATERLGELLAELDRRKRGKRSRISRRPDAPPCT